MTRSASEIRADLEHPHTAALTALHSTTIGDGPIGRLLRDVEPLLDRCTFAEQLADEAGQNCADLWDAVDKARAACDDALANIRRRDQAKAWSLAAAVVVGSIDVEHLTRQAEWSARTFGPGPRTRGVIDHITKEFDEILADPSVIDEWIDVVILAFDGALRTGAPPARIIEAIKAKQEQNEARTWPDFRDFGEDVAIEHDRSAT